MPKELRGIVTARWSRLRNETCALHFVLPTVTDVTLKLITGTPLIFHVSFQLVVELGAAAAGAASSTVSAIVAANTVARTESPRRDAIDTTTIDWLRLCLVWGGNTNRAQERGCVPLAVSSWS